MKLANLLEKNRYKVMRRMALWEGRLNRGRLIGVLALTGVRVSHLPSEVRESTPHWFEWDNKSQSYYFTDFAYRETNIAPQPVTSELSLATYCADAVIHPYLDP